MVGRALGWRDQDTSCLSPRSKFSPSWHDLADYGGYLAWQQGASMRQIPPRRSASSPSSSILQACKSASQGLSRVAAREQTAGIAAPTIQAETRACWHIAARICALCISPHPWLIFFFFFLFFFSLQMRHSICERANHHSTKCEELQHNDVNSCHILMHQTYCQGGMMFPSLPVCVTIPGMAGRMITFRASSVAVRTSFGPTWPLLMSAARRWQSCSVSCSSLKSSFLACRTCSVKSLPGQAWLSKASSICACWTPKLSQAKATLRRKLRCVRSHRAQQIQKQDRRMLRT